MDQAGTTEASAADEYHARLFPEGVIVFSLERHRGLKQEQAWQWSI